MIRNHLEKDNIFDLNSYHMLFSTLTISHDLVLKRRYIKLDPSCQVDLEFITRVIQHNQSETRFFFKKPKKI